MTFKRVLGTILSATLLSASSIPVSAREAPVRVPSGMAAAIDAVAAKALVDRATAGLAVAVSQNGKVTFARGYGSADLENFTKVTDETVFRIGSITKEFTAAGILLLAEQKKLSIDDRVSKYLPAFPRGDQVTIRQLLNHTSGIRNYTSLPSFQSEVSHQEHTTAEMVGVIAAAQPLFDFEPGTSWSYSNSGFFLLGAIIEKVSGQSYAVFTKRAILDPLGLSHTQVDDLAAIVPHRAHGYDKAKDSPVGFTNADYISMTVAAAAGAMRSTVADLARWQDALLARRLLSRKSVKLMTTPGRLKDGRLASAARPPAPDQPASDYGFGISTTRRDGRLSIGHGGSINGFNASVATYPDRRVTIVLLTNTTGGTVGLSPPLADAVLGSTNARSAKK